MYFDTGVDGIMVIGETLLVGFLGIFSAIKIEAESKLKWSRIEVAGLGVAGEIGRNASVGELWGKGMREGGKGGGGMVGGVCSGGEECR